MSSIDNEIVSLLLSNENDAARSSLLQDIRVKFEKIARYKGVKRDDIDDVVSDGTEKLLNKLPNFHGRGSFSAWATVLFGNHCIDYFRHLAVKNRVFDSDLPRRNDHEETAECFDLFPSDCPDPCERTVNQQQLENVLSIMDRVIAETAALRREGKRDAEIARLGLKELLEPKAILEKMLDRFPGLSVNAIRIVLHTFRAALRHALDE